MGLYLYQMKQVENQFRASFKLAFLTPQPIAFEFDLRIIKWTHLKPFVTTQLLTYAHLDVDWHRFRR